ncbi:MAG TPA: hypothetical protein VJ813_13520 [Vicinamibacterales bacterium]|nr:hypothetical protein [Vicinamibacterales bacterium]
MSFRALHALATIVLIPLFIGAGHARPVRDSPTAANAPAVTTLQVAGSGYDDLNNAIVHSKTPTPTGLIQQSTEIVELDGDLRGRVLYHVTSVFDFVNGTLVNTGDQVFSGTIAGSAPVLLHDDQFRFQVNLATGEETGEVHLLNHIAGPKARCRLDVVGTGLNTEGNPTFDYTGECTFRGL